jgi:glycosyltransferase involved in cell wall biosynthesis
MTIDIVQFNPLIGGETTLTKILFKILVEMGHECRSITPSPSGRKLSGWQDLENQVCVKYKEFGECVKESDIVLFINSIHLKSKKKKEDQNKAFETVRVVFEQVKDKNLIFSEYGLHTMRLYAYEDIFKILSEQNNRIVLFTSTKASIPIYANMGYEAFLIRQPFDIDFYPPIDSPDPSEKLQICFNSRYTANKRPQDILPFFNKYIKGDKSEFQLNLRGNVRDNCTIWYNLQEYFTDDRIVIHPYFEHMYQIYDKQDFCIYAGYTTLCEKGKMEYSILESIYYDIPLICESDVFEHFQYDEYGITREQLRECFIFLNQKNLDDIISGNLDGKPYAKKAKELLLNDFLPDAIKRRIEIGLKAFDRPSRTNQSLF